MTPEPARHLFEPGRTAWDSIWTGLVYETTSPALVQLILVVCELIDEHAALRVTVLRDRHWRDRAALRALNLQLITGLTAIADRTGNGSSSGSSPFDALLAALGDAS